MVRNPTDNQVMRELIDREEVRNLPGAAVILVADLTLEIYKRIITEQRHAEAKQVDY